MEIQTSLTLSQVFCKGDTLAPYQFIICRDYILQMSIDLMKENGFMLEKARNRWCSAKTITDTDYADDIVLLENTPAQAESLLHSLELAAGGIGLNVLYSKRRHSHTKRWFSETSGQVHIPWKQCLINRKRHQYATSKGMDNYR